MSLPPSASQKIEHRVALHYRALRVTPGLCCPGLTPVEAQITFSCAVWPRSRDVKCSKFQVVCCLNIKYSAHKETSKEHDKSPDSTKIALKFMKAINFAWYSVPLSSCYEVDDNLLNWTAYMVYGDKNAEVFSSLTSCLYILRQRTIDNSTLQKNQHFNTYNLYI